MRFSKFFFVALATLTVAVFPATGQNHGRAIFLPFDIQATQVPAHLENGLAGVLASRVAANTGIRAITGNRAAERMREALRQGDFSAAGRLLAESGADYLILGDVRPEANRYTVTSYVFSRAEAAPRKAARSFGNVDDPLPAVEELALDVAALISGRRAGPEPGRESSPEGSPFTDEHPERDYRRETLSAALPGLEQAGSEFELLADLRGRPIKMEARDLGIADLDGDGVSDLVFLATKSLEVYRYEDGRFIHRLTQPLPGHLNYLALTLVDANNNGLPELYVGASNGNLAASSIWEWRDGRLRVLEENVPYYLHAVAFPGGDAMLLGQQPPPDRPGGGKIHLMRYEGERLAPSGRTLPIIEGYNVYDVAPVDLDGDGRLEIAALDRNNRLQVFKSGALLWTSADEYGASRNFYGTVSAVAQSEEEPILMHTRIVAAHLDQDGGPTLIVSKNREVRVPYVPGIRFLNGGSLCALQWDGAGLRLLWETRRVPGAVSGHQVVPGPTEADGFELFFVELETPPFFQPWAGTASVPHRLVLTRRRAQP